MRARFLVCLLALGLGSLRLTVRGGCEKGSECLQGAGRGGGFPGATLMSAWHCLALARLGTQGLGCAQLLTRQMPPHTPFFL